jgi:hypothetical protein
MLHKALGRMMSEWPRRGLLIFVVLMPALFLPPAESANMTGTVLSSPNRLVVLHENRDPQRVVPASIRRVKVNSRQIRSAQRGSPVIYDAKKRKLIGGAQKV